MRLDFLRLAVLGRRSIWAVLRLVAAWQFGTGVLWASVACFVNCTLIRQHPCPRVACYPLPCGSLKSRQAFRASQLAPTDKMPVSLINATAEEAADYFRPRPPSPTFAFLFAFWHFCLGFGGFRSAFAGFLVPSVLVFPREARAGCLLRDLPAWPRTLNLIRSQLTKPDVIRVQLQGAVAAVPPSLSRPHLHKEGSTERARLTCYRQAIPLVIA